MRKGTTRLVFLTKRHAIKIPNLLNGYRLFLQGLLGNMQEIEFSSTGWEQLCPVKWYLPLGLMVIMRRARELTDDEWSLFDGRLFREMHCVPVENKQNSFGVLDNRIVAIDYGS